MRWLPAATVNESARGAVGVEVDDLGLEEVCEVVGADVTWSCHVRAATAGKDPDELGERLVSRIVLGTQAQTWTR